MASGDATTELTKQYAIYVRLPPSMLTGSGFPLSHALLTWTSNIDTKTQTSGLALKISYCTINDFKKIACIR